MNLIFTQDSLKFIRLLASWPEEFREVSDFLEVA